MSRPTTSLTEHVQSPRNVGVIASAEAVGRADRGGRAPRCKFHLRIRRGIVKLARFQASGCGYAVAACSRLTELVADQSIDACQRITAEKLIEDLGGRPRHKHFCAGLAVAALRDGLQRWTARVADENKQEDDES